MLWRYFHKKIRKETYFSILVDLIADTSYVEQLSISIITYVDFDSKKILLSFLKSLI